MSYTIYCHTNKQNGKKYVGLTKNEPKKRWNNGRSYQHNTKFWKDIVKYGWDGFTHEILADGLTKEEAQEKEDYFIEHYNSRNNGYNIQHGGRAPEPTFLCSTLVRFRMGFKKDKKRDGDLKDEILSMLERGDKDKDFAELLNLMCERAYKHTMIHGGKPHWEDDTFICEFIYNFGYEIRVCNWIDAGCVGEMPKYKPLSIAVEETLAGRTNLCVS